MRTTHPLSITLPHEMAAMVKAKVASGEYATESEVIRDGLRALRDRDVAVERWLREEVAAGHEEYLANPGSGVSADQLLARIKARRAAAKA
jgi:putative addiction module CopG family antidote